jgi:hypothetical protein
MASTCIPAKLRTIALILCEENNSDDGASKACFQYIVENRILEELTEFAKADVSHTDKDWFFRATDTNDYSSIDSIWHENALSAIFLHVYD